MGIGHIRFSGLGRCINFLVCSDKVHDAYDIYFVNVIESGLCISSRHIIMVLEVENTLV